ncbi:STAS domain-containing protein [Streptomyces sp. NPDC055085]
MASLSIITRSSSAGAVIELAGDLDYASVPGFRESVIYLSLAQGEQLTLELAALAYCDSTGITALIAAHDLALERGAQMILAAVPDGIARIPPAGD